MPSDHPSTPDPARLDRVEEALAFTDRSVEHLSAEIADLNKRLAHLTKRLAALEAGLSRLQHPPDPDDPDPA